MIEIKWLGRGGQGGFTASRLLGLSAALYEGKFALAFPSFGPERRGAPVQAFTKISDEKIHDRSQIKLCDYIVLLDETLFSPVLFSELKPGGTIVLNSGHPEKYREAGVKDPTNPMTLIIIDATSLALEILQKPVTNTAMLGALIGASDIISLDSAIQGIRQELKPSIIPQNIELIRRAYTMVKEGWA